MAGFHIFFTIVLFIVFIGIFVWAYSNKRKRDFEVAAQLPFADEQNHHNGDRT